MLQLPYSPATMSKLFILAGASIILTQSVSSQTVAAPLAEPSFQLKASQAPGVHTRIAAKALHDRRALYTYNHHHSRFHYAGRVRRHRYTLLQYDYDGGDYYPPQGHYFSHRYNWWPPLATFRYPDGPWYAW
jgi:hypothetical protein